MYRLLGLLLFALALLSPAKQTKAGCIIGGGIFCVTSGFTASCSQSSDFLARATAITNDTDKTNYDTLICGLETDGIGCSNTLDLLYVLAAPDSATSLLNLCSASFALTTSGTITFAANEGYTSNGTTGYLDTNYTPSTNAVLSTLNSTIMGVYDRTNRTTNNNSVQFGGKGPAAHYSYMTILDTTDRVETSVNSSNFPTFTTNTNAQGAVSSSRTGASAAGVYKNLTSISLTIAGSANSTGLPDGKLFIAALNSNGSTLQYTTDQLAAAWYGAGLTGANSVLLHTRINNFMTAYGKNVF